MPNEQLIAVLSYGATFSGAGVIASLLFERIKNVFPPPKRQPGKVLVLLYKLLHAPRYARQTAMVFPIVIAALLAIPLSYMTHDSYWTIISTSLLAPVVNQVYHGLTDLSPEIKGYAKTERTDAGGDTSGRG